MTASSPSLALHPTHPWASGHIFESPGAHMTYRVIGPCCRLYDRDQLPWPCCRIQWRSKEPSWRRIGARFTVDMATRKHPSYCVEIIGQSYRSEPITMTLYTVKMARELQAWWHTKRVQAQPLEIQPPEIQPPEISQLEISQLEMSQLETVKFLQATASC